MKWSSANNRRGRNPSVSLYSNSRLGFFALCGVLIIGTTGCGEPKFTGSEVIMTIDGEEFVMESNDEIRDRGENTDDDEQRFVLEIEKQKFQMEFPNIEPGRHRGSEAALELELLIGDEPAKFTSDNCRDSFDRSEVIVEYNEFDVVSGTFAALVCLPSGDEDEAKDIEGEFAASVDESWLDKY